MRVLITGADGQLGRALHATAPNGWNITAVRRAELDVTDRTAAAAAVARLRPELMINAAAYNLVDKAETESRRAFAVNADGPANLAAAARMHGARFFMSRPITCSTAASPRRTSRMIPPRPLNTYGRSKLEGETRAHEESAGQALIVRTAWVYAAHGHNFVKTILHLNAERDSLRVVCDQISTPTWASTLAQVLWAAAARPALRGIYHWTDAGVASWYDLAVAIQEEALTLGLIVGAIPIHPISTADYPLPAARPAYSVLDKSKTLADLGLEGLHWRTVLRQMLVELKHA